MAFHADYWVVTGTTAPVIALATIVTGGDTLRMVAVNRPFLIDDLPTKTFIALMIAVLNSINLLLQSVELIAALESLQNERDIGSIWLGQQYLFYGLFILFGTSLFNAYARFESVRRVKPRPYRVARVTKTMNHTRFTNNKPQHERRTTPRRYRVAQTTRPASNYTRFASNKRPRPPKRSS
jgi:hypothetical protein